MDKETLNSEIGRYISLTEDELRSVFDSIEDDSIVSEAMQYSLFAGGKRIRAVLTLACCEASGGTAEIAVPAAAAMELLHCYSLIHDDLPSMDNDDLRRGKPSCHKAFGEANAILAGDALLTEAFGELCQIDDPLKAISCVNVLSNAAGIRGMVFGQELDILNEDNASMSQDMLDYINLHKTGKLIEASCIMGGICGGADISERNALRTYAQIIGNAFQITDDILDVTSTADVIGKTKGKDENMGKVTYASLLGVDKAMKEASRMTEEACDAVKNAFGEKAEFLITFARFLLHRIK